VVRLKIEREELIEKLRELSNSGYNYLVKITAVDYIDHLEVIYFIRNMQNKKEEHVRLDLKDGESLPTVIEIYKSADYYERELSEMFGIAIEGREVKRLLLEKWDGLEAPLRKSFPWGSDYKSG
jgi:NADH-quinone oxidoreductase subunit C